MKKKRLKRKNRIRFVNEHRILDKNEGWVRTVKIRESLSNAKGSQSKYSGVSISKLR